jgi:hypothetical protein
MPLDDALEAAHKHSVQNRVELERSEICGCFYCGKTFAPTRVQEWIDDGKTALCPFCSIDSVLSSASGFSLDHEFLRKMHDYWF